MVCMLKFWYKLQAEVFKMFLFYIFRAGVNGHNNAGVLAYKRQLDIWYREQNIVLDKVNRSQKKVYQLMCEVHEEKKRIEENRAKNEGNWLNSEETSKTLSECVYGRGDLHLRYCSTLDACSGGQNGQNQRFMIDRKN